MGSWLYCSVAGRNGQTTYLIGLGITCHALVLTVVISQGLTNCQVATPTNRHVTHLRGHDPFAAGEIGSRLFLCSICLFSEFFFG